MTILPPIDMGWNDRTDAAGLSSIATRCQSASLTDLDGDGAPDLIVSIDGLQVFKNDGAGHFAPWADVKLSSQDAALLAGRCPQAVADLDGDGRLDVVIALQHGDRLAVFWNEGGGTFTPALVGTADPVANPKLSAFSVGVLTGIGQDPVVFVGREIDGAAMRAGNELMANPQDCTALPNDLFDKCNVTIDEPVSFAVQIGPGRAIAPAVDLSFTQKGDIQGLGVLDTDGDGHADILIARDFGLQTILQGTGSSLVAPPGGWGVTHYGNGMGVAFGDWDGDPFPDAMVTTFFGVLDYAGVSGGGFRYRGEKESLVQKKLRAIWPWAILFSDLDNDGREDVFIVNEFASSTASNVNQWVQSIGGPADFVGSFDTIFFHRKTEMQEARLPYAALRPAQGEGSSVAIADVDGDGRLEVLLPIARQSDGAYDLVLGSPAVDHYGHGLTVALEKPSPGTKIELVAGGTKQVRTLYGAEGHCAAARTYAHFGCGDATSYDSIAVTPPGSAPFTLPSGPLDRAIFVHAP